MHQDSAAYTQLKRRRLKARRVMMALAVVCALVALGLGAFQLHVEGLHEFLYRAPGVGASK